MSNNYAPCFIRIDFVVIPSYVELPCKNVSKHFSYRKKRLSLGKSGKKINFKTEKEDEIDKINLKFDN